MVTLGFCGFGPGTVGLGRGRMQGDPVRGSRASRVDAHGAEDAFTGALGNFSGVPGDQLPERMIELSLYTEEKL